MSDPAALTEPVVRVLCNPEFVQFSTLIEGRDTYTSQIYDRQTPRINHLLRCAVDDTWLQRATHERPFTGTGDLALWIYGGSSNGPTQPGGIFISAVMMVRYLKKEIELNHD